MAFGAAAAEDDEAGVALEAQPDLVPGGRALVGLELHPQLLDEVGVAARQGHEGLAVGGAGHDGGAPAGLLLLEAGQQAGGLDQVVGRELALGQLFGQGRGLFEQGAGQGGEAGVVGLGEVGAAVADAAG